MPVINVTLYTRENCSLCDKAKAAIRASGVPIELTEVDIDGDPLLHDLYDVHVPVVFVDGKEAFRHFVYPEEFRDYAASLSLSKP
jgi:glutaredoxin